MRFNVAPTDVMPIVGRSREGETRSVAGELVLDASQSAASIRNDRDIQSGPQNV